MPLTTRGFFIAKMSAERIFEHQPNLESRHLPLIILMESDDIVAKQSVTGGALVNKPDRKSVQLPGLTDLALGGHLNAKYQGPIEVIAAHADDLQKMLDRITESPAIVVAVLGTRKLKNKTAGFFTRSLHNLRDVINSHPWANHPRVNIVFGVNDKPVPRGEERRRKYSKTDTGYRREMVMSLLAEARNFST